MRKEATDISSRANILKDNIPRATSIIELITANALAESLIKLLISFLIYFALFLRRLIFIFSINLVYSFLYYYYYCCYCFPFFYLTSLTSALLK